MRKFNVPSEKEEIEREKSLLPTSAQDVIVLGIDFSRFGGDVLTRSNLKIIVEIDKYLQELEGIRKYIGKDADYYKESDPIILGTNTYRQDLDLSLPATAFIEHLDKIGMVVEYPDEKEKDEDIYVKSFYFIATNNTSVSQESSGKEVLQFNYRWPGFHTMPPDHLCMDELVRVAEGLYLGQLLYATDPTLKYSPEKDPAVYKYENFGYFMLMDDEWHAIKEFIAFDTE